ncbi:MAG: hypothetical protein M3M95_06105 [Pseudomonadota bacterium]|nr:hypothetical protein [Pseudomonadota bacterium]
MTRAPRGRIAVRMAEDGKPPKAPPTTREAKLAAALRANLRRRKAPAAPERKADSE